MSPGYNEPKVRTAARVDVEDEKFGGRYLTFRLARSGRMWDIRTWDYEEDAKRCYNEGPANTCIFHLPADDAPTPVAMSDELRKQLPYILRRLEQGEIISRDCPNWADAFNHLCGSTYCILRRAMADAGIEVGK